MSTRTPPATTHALAERHEALWVSLQALHKDVAALAAKKPEAAVSAPVRIVAEGLLSDSVPFLGRPKEKLPVAAPDLLGLVVQLGQALAALETWEVRHSFWDSNKNYRSWRVGEGDKPVMRLRPVVAEKRDPRTEELRERLARRFAGQRSMDFEAGFAAGREARNGKPIEAIRAEAEKTYAHLWMRD